MKIIDQCNGWVKTEIDYRYIKAPFNWSTSYFIPLDYNLDNKGKKKGIQVWIDYLRTKKWFDRSCEYSLLRLIGSPKPSLRGRPRGEQLQLKV